ncbi:MAG TPA: fibronectin type III domain-containing protein [Chloroflexota bacterium]|nr:fibronectin type III domain-containing protein [Chloroflexota bacterium]
MMAASSLASAPAWARSTVIQGLQVTDLSDSAFAVTFTTMSERTAAVRYGTSPTHLTAIALDDRDLAAGARQPTHRSTIHRILLSRLTYGTTYYFEPVVEGTAQASNSGRPFRQETAPLNAPLVPTRVHGTVVTATRSIPAPGTVLLIGQWINPDGSKCWPVSVLNDPPMGTHAAATFDLVPTLLTASGSGSFTVSTGAVFRVVAAADDRGRLVTGSPVTARRGIHITIVPLLRLRAPAK